MTINQLQQLAARVLANPTPEVCRQLADAYQSSIPEVEKFCAPPLADPSKIDELTEAEREAFMDAMEAQADFMFACTLAWTVLIEPEEAADLQREIKRRQDRRRRHRTLRVVGEE